MIPCLDFAVVCALSRRPRLCTHTLIDGNLFGRVGVVGLKVAAAFTYLESFIDPPLGKTVSYEACRYHGAGGPAIRRGGGWCNQGRERDSLGSLGSASGRKRGGQSWRRREISGR